MAIDGHKDFNEECRILLAALTKHFDSKKTIAILCLKKSPILKKYKEGTIISYFSQIKDDNFRFSHDFPIEELMKILNEILLEQPIKDTENNGTIIFHYWSEGRKEHEDSDGLKIAYISLNLNDLKSITNKPCELIYIENNKIKDTIKGEFRKKDSDESIVRIFNFLNGTSLMMYIHDSEDFVGKFYKGTYIALPHTYLACGIGLFEIYQKKINEFLNTDNLASHEQERIAAELNKKRFLLSNNAWFYDVHDFKTNDSFNELEKIKKHFIRYRKSATTGNIHGDLIKIEPIGRVLYKGFEKANKNGRCFIQKNWDDKLAKNLVIELYQEADSNKQGFEFRNPHSFMMFDLRIESPVIRGHLLKPKTDYFPHSGTCFLIEVTDKRLNESSFNPANFEFKSISSEQIFNIIKPHHVLPNWEVSIIEAFKTLLLEE